AGVSIFLIGSLSCAMAQSMNQLLAARFLQGIGGGAIGTLGMAAIADLVPARQVGRWLGYQGIAFAVASVIGPTVGGLFVDHLSWRWAFTINLPLGTLGIVVLATQMDVPYRRLPHAIDWMGAALLGLALACFIVLTTLGGRDFAWISGRTALFIVGVAVLGGAFVLWERWRAAEPVLPLGLFRDRLLRVTSVLNWTSGLLLWCGIFFVPLYMQEVHGVSPTKS